MESTPDIFPRVVCGREYLPSFIALCDASVCSIDLLFYYWQIRLSSNGHPISKVIDALKNARARGVTVRVLSVNAGVCAEMRRLKFETRQFHTGKTMHVKMAIFDSTHALVGSHNMTQNAMLNNWEISLLAQYPDANHRLNELFENLWAL